MSDHGRTLRVSWAPSSPEAGHQEPSIDIDPADPRGWTVEPAGDGRWTVRDPDGAVRRALVITRGETIEVVVAGWRFDLVVEDASRAVLRERGTRTPETLSHDATTDVRAIIPGRVVEVAVAEGDEVELGQRLLVVEAMKMQNELKAPRSGSVARVAVGEGMTVDLGDLLVVLR